MIEVIQSVAIAVLFLLAIYNAWIASQLSEVVLDISNLVLEIAESIEDKE